MPAKFFSPVPVRRSAPLLLLVFAVLPVVGCSPVGGKDPTDVPEVSIDDYQDVTASLDYRTGTVTLPLDPYRDDSPAITARVVAALEAVRNRCMSDAGLRPPAGSAATEQPASVENRRYGVWSVQNASLYGFALPPEVQDAAYAPDMTSMGVEYNRILDQCTETARSALSDEFAYLDEPDLDWRLRDRAEALTLASEQGAAAVTLWRTCTEDAGVVLDPESGFPSEQYARQSKEAEIHVAVTYAQCGVDTGAVQTLFDIQAKYEAAFVDAYEAALAEQVSRRDEVLASLDATASGR